MNVFVHGLVLVFVFVYCSFIIYFLAFHVEKWSDSVNKFWYLPGSSALLGNFERTSFLSTSIWNYIFHNLFILFYFFAWTRMKILLTLLPLGPSSSQAGVSLIFPWQVGLVSWPLASVMCHFGRCAGPNPNIKLKYTVGSSSTFQARGLELCEGSSEVLVLVLGRFCADSDSVLGYDSAFFWWALGAEPTFWRQPPRWDYTLGVRHGSRCDHVRLACG